MNKKNSGFSLVELIVVIAIMAVLVGVLAPAYLKYVEKSRKSADISAISDIMDAATKIATDVQFEDNIDKNTEFIVEYTTGVIKLKVNKTKYEAALTEDATAAEVGGTGAHSNQKVVNAWGSDANVKSDGYKVKSKNWKSISASTAQTSTGTADANGAISWISAGVTKSNVDADSSTDFWKATRGYSSDFNKKFAS